MRNINNQEIEHNKYYNSTPPPPPPQPNDSGIAIWAYLGNGLPVILVIVAQ